MWLECNQFREPCAGFDCSGGVMSLFVTDAQAASRSKTGGQSVPSSLRGGLVFAKNHLALPLEVDADAFKTIAAPSSVPPKPARALTPLILYHLCWLAENATSAFVQAYASCFVVMCTVKLL